MRIPALKAFLITMMAGAMVLAPAVSADNLKSLTGYWAGKATGPQGGPPTGDLDIVFEKSGSGLKGTVMVKGPGGLQYSGELSAISLKDGVFSATVSFKLGETPLAAQVRGPLAGKTIAGTFTVVSNGATMGDGTFSISKGKKPDAGSRKP